jgi:hypothetical protein
MIDIFLHRAAQAGGIGGRHAADKGTAYGRRVRSYESTIRQQNLVHISAYRATAYTYALTVVQHVNVRPMGPHEPYGDLLGNGLAADSGAGAPESETDFVLARPAQQRLQVFGGSHVYYGPGARLKGAAVH